MLQFIKRWAAARRLERDREMVRVSADHCTSRLMGALGAMGDEGRMKAADLIASDRNGVDLFDRLRALCAGYRHSGFVGVLCEANSTERMQVATALRERETKWVGQLIDFIVTRQASEAFLNAEDRKAERVAAAAN